MLFRSIRERNQTEGEEKRERLTEEGHERVDERRVAVEEEEDRADMERLLPHEGDLRGIVGRQLVSVSVGCAGAR